MNTLPREEAVRALHLLVEGASLRSVVRLTGTHRTTVIRLMLRAGDRLREFLGVRMRGLELRHIQADEIWTFCLKKQARLTPDEQDDPTIGDQFLFVALDQMTKLVPCFALGKRTRQVTEAFALDLAARIITPQLGEKGDRPQISTDGWAAYPNAIDLAFADTVRHGVLIKDYQQSEQPGRAEAWSSVTIPFAE